MGIPKMIQTIKGSARAETPFSASPLSSVAGSTSDAFSTLLATRATPTWMEEVVRQLEALASVSENWNSYGARAASLESIEAARRILVAMSKIVGINQPDLGLSPDGNVAATWELAGGTRQLDIEILSTGRINFAFAIFGAGGIDYSGSTSDLSTIAGILTQW